MDHYVVEDASFLISVLNPNDSLHPDAIKILKILNKSKNSITFVLPEIAVCETVFTLMKMGIDPGIIRQRINDLSMLPKVIIINNDIMTILRYASRFYNSLTLLKQPASITKTHDYIIACTCKDFNGILLTGDDQIIRTFSSQGVDYCNFHELSSREQFKKKIEE